MSNDTSTNQTLADAYDTTIAAPIRNEEEPIATFGQVCREEDLNTPETLVAQSVSSVGYPIKNYKLPIPKLNRAERRAMAKKAGKRGRANAATISEAAKKLTYTHLIEELRKLNEKNEGENGNEDATEDR